MTIRGALVLVGILVSGCSWNGRPVGDDVGDDGGDDVGDDGGDDAPEYTGCRFAHAAFAAAALRTDVKELTDDNEGRAPGSPGGRAAEDYIALRMGEIGLDGPVGGGYRQAFDDPDGEPTANLVGVIPGRGDEVVLITAHHDHLGVVDGDVYPGANDNASGVAGVLAIAAAMKPLGMPERTVVFAAVGAEENLDESYPGSAYFAAHPPGFALADVVYDINLDMIGTYRYADELLAIGATLSTTAVETLRDKATCYPELVIDDEGFGGDSDSETFCDRSIPHTYFFTDDPPCYHEPCDTSDRIDYDNMALVAQLAFDLAWERANRDGSLRGERSGDLQCVDPDDE